MKVSRISAPTQGSVAGVTTLLLKKDRMGRLPVGADSGDYGTLGVPTVRFRYVKDMLVYAC